MNSDEQAISSLVASWHRATAAGDVDAVLALMADDAIFLVAGQPPLRGRSTFEHGRANCWASIAFTRAVRSRRSWSPATLLIAGAC